MSEKPEAAAPGDPRTESSKPLTPSPSSPDKPPSPPKSTQEAFWSIAWRYLPPIARVVLVVALLLIGGGFAIWTSLPSSSKESVIAWFTHGPTPATGFWRIDAVLGADAVAPGALLELTVEADHDGYVWVFTVEGDHGVLLYPQEEDLTGLRHRIDRGTRRAVPSRDDTFGLQAGTDAGEEVLIVIATNNSSNTAAWGRLAALRPDLQVKASPIRTGEWGAVQLRYEVME